MVRSEHGANRKPVAEREAGEPWVRGPNVMNGYYRSGISAPDGFNIRDLARLENGNLFIVWRAKDLIVGRGFNVYPAEKEMNRS